MNSERVALTRRLEDDDQWVSPAISFFASVSMASVCWRVSRTKCPKPPPTARSSQVVPHNIFLALYANASCNVLAFDPRPFDSCCNR